MDPEQHEWEAEWSVEYFHGREHLGLDRWEAAEYADSMMDAPVATADVGLPDIPVPLLNAFWGQLSKFREGLR